MAVGSGDPVNLHTGNGVTRTFAYGFTLLNRRDLRVSVDGVETSDFAVFGIGAANGGSIVFTTAPAVGAKVLIELVIELARVTQYQTNGDLLSATVNADFDRLWQAVLASDYVSRRRALRVPAGETVADLPSAAERANTVQAYDGAGRPIVLDLPVDLPETPINRPPDVVATQGQTVVTVPFAYTRGNNSLRVFLSGSIMEPGDDYLETSTTSITFTVPLEEGDEITFEGGARLNPSSAIDALSATAAASGGGLSLIGFDRTLTPEPGSAAEALQRTPITVDAITSVDATALKLRDGDVVVARGRSAAGDGGGGTFRYSASSTQIVDGGLVFTPTAGTGRLFRDGWTVFGFNGKVLATWFGAIGDGSTASSAAVSAAVAAVGALGGGIVLIPSGVFFFNSTVEVSLPRVYVEGESQGATVILRTGDYGSTFRFTGNNATGTLLEDVGISKLTFKSTGLTTSGAHVEFNGVWRFKVEDIYLRDGFIGLQMKGALAGSISKIYAVFSNLYGGSEAGRRYIEFGNATGAYTHPSCGDLFVDAYNLRGNTSAQVTEYGVHILSGDGLWFSNGHVGNASTANLRLSASTSELLNLVSFSNTMFDEGLLRGIEFSGSTPSTFRSIQFSNCIVKSGGSPTAFATNGVIVTPGCTADNVQFSNVTVTEFGGTAVSLQSSAAGAGSGFEFANCNVFNNSRNSVGAAPGYNLLANVKNVRIIGGMSGGSAYATQSYGVQISTGHTGVLVTGVDLTGNAVGSINGTSAGALFDGCLLDGATPTVASASSITIPEGRKMLLVSGTTNISNIGIGSFGQEVTLLFQGALTVNDSAGNIRLASNYTTSADDTLTLVCDGTNWYEISRSAN